MYSPLNVVVCNMLATCSESQLTWALPDQGERKFHQKDTLLCLFFCPYKPSQTSPVCRPSMGRVSWDPNSSRASQVKQQGTSQQPERNTQRGAAGKPVDVIPPMRSSYASEQLHLALQDLLNMSPCMKVTKEQITEARAASERDAQNLFAGKNDG